MQEIKGLISVIIPAYNAEKFIKETIDSVKKQTYTSWEIIVVNDGSKDLTAAIVTKELSENIHLINQENQGVSAARNNGISYAKGEYIVFFDADDLMTPEFLSEKVKVLDKNPNLGFVGGLVQSFPDKFIHKAAARNLPDEILFFKPDISTAPSTYLVRKQDLLNHTIRFNIALSSTADKFFILQLAAIAKGRSLETDNGKLLYRIHDQSMSNKLSAALVKDNEKYYYEIVKAGLLPVKRKREFQGFYFFSLALSFGKLGSWASFLKYLLKSFFSSPIIFFKLLFKKRKKFNKNA